MIRVTVREAAERRGVRTYYQLARLLGDDQDVRAKRLWEGEALPTLPTLDKVCDALGCELAELVTRVPPKTHRQRPANGSASKRKPPVRSR